MLRNLLCDVLKLFSLTFQKNFQLSNFPFTFSLLYAQPVGIYPKKYEWASTMSYGLTSHNSGDCSLWVRAATIDFDDGAWECQVTASDFTTQDALTSAPVQLVVRGEFTFSLHIFI